MSVRRRFVRRTALLALATVVLSACHGDAGHTDSAAAGATPATPATTAAGSSTTAAAVAGPAPYRLTMPALERMMDAQGRIAQAVRKDPSIDAQFADEHATLEQSAEKIESIPALKAALTANGLTATEFLRIQVAYVQSTMAAQMIRSGEPRADVLRQLNATPENLKFVDDHAADLKTAQDRVTGKYGK
jgi:hypothetical protein